MFCTYSKGLIRIFFFLSSLVIWDYIIYAPSAIIHSSDVLLDPPLLSSDVRHVKSTWRFVFLFFFFAGSACWDDVWRRTEFDVFLELWMIVCVRVNLSAVDASVDARCPRRTQTRKCSTTLRSSPAILCRGSLLSREFFLCFSFSSSASNMHCTHCYMHRL
jgi:hypothetical protein